MGQSALTGSFFSPRFGSKSLRRRDEKNNKRRLQVRASDYIGVIVANHWDDLRCLSGSPSLFQNEKTLQNLLSVCSLEMLIRSPWLKKRQVSKTTNSRQLVVFGLSPESGRDPAAAISSRTPASVLKSNSEDVQNSQCVCTRSSRSRSSRKTMQIRPIIN